MNTPLVTITDVSVSLGRHQVLREINLTLYPGQVLALVGPNAAGKTTLLRCVAGALNPDKGKIEVSPSSLGWVGHQSFLYDELTVEENLRFWAGLFSLKNPDRRIRELLHQFDLNLVLHEPVGVLSHGMTKRVSLARALLADPAVLLLDEPFNGLDQSGIAYLMKVFERCRNSSRAILFTSHQIPIVLQACTHVAVLVRGRLTRTGPVGEFNSESLARELS
jgi:heme exporter protein A